MSHLINMTAKAMVPHDVSSSAYSQTVNIRVDGYLIFVYINFGKQIFIFVKCFLSLFVTVYNEAINEFHHILKLY